MVAAVPARVAAPLLAVRPAVASAQIVRRRSLVHTDCGPGNLVRARHGLVLIDWQCPGRGDPVEDIACFLSPAMMILYEAAPHSPAARDAFLAAYPDRAAVARYERDGLAWHYRIGGYCVWRAHRLARRQPEVAARYRRALAAEIELMERWQ
jgi:aminoglycoside phosphotransferase (APT) family kinase protein